MDIHSGAVTSTPNQGMISQVIPVHIIITTQMAATHGSFSLSEEILLPSLSLE